MKLYEIVDPIGTNELIDINELKKKLKVELAKPMEEQDTNYIKQLELAIRASSSWGEIS